MDSFQGIPYEDLPPNFLLTTTHRPTTPTQDILSSNLPASTSGFSALRPSFLRRNADAYVVRNCSEKEMQTREAFGQMVQDAELGNEFRPDLPEFKSTVIRQRSRGRGREEEERAEVRPSLQRNPSLPRQRNPSLPRQRSRSRSRARTVVPGDEASPPVPALPSLVRLRTAVAEGSEVSSAIQRNPSLPRQRSRSRGRVRTVMPGDDASPPVPALPNEHRSEPIGPGDNEASGPRPKEHGGSISTINTQVSETFDNAAPTSTTETRASSVSANKGVWYSPTQSLNPGHPLAELLLSLDPPVSSTNAVCGRMHSSPTHSIDFAPPIPIPSRPSISPMFGPGPAPAPAHGNLTLPEAALPPKHVDFDASCSSHPQSCRLKTGILNKIKNAVHNVDKSIARFISHRKDQKYLCSQRKRELANRKSRNKLLDSNNRRAISSHRQKNANMKIAIKAQKQELEKCKKVDKEKKKKAEKESKEREKWEREQRGKLPLGREIERMFGWGLRVDGVGQWLAWKCGRMPKI